MAHCCLRKTKTKTKTNNTKLLENKHKKILHVVPGPSTVKRCSILAESGRSGQCGTLWLRANWIQMRARACANCKHCSLRLEMLRHCGERAPHCSFAGTNLSSQLRMLSRDSSDSLYMAARTSEKAQSSSTPRLRSSNMKQ